ncbi:hypothetical protein DPEC_G00377860, partial [Dallia pectoralis]
MDHYWFCVLVLLSTLIIFGHSQECSPSRTITIRSDCQYQCQGTRTGDTVVPSTSLSLETVDTDLYRKVLQKQDSELVETTSGSSYKLNQVSVSDRGQYRCRAGRGDPVYYTQYSKPVNIQITDLPSAAVNISPVRPLYSGETVTLQCDISGYTDWSFQWYRNKERRSPGSPSRTITTLSDQVGQYQYQCMGTRTGRPQSSQLSGSLHINVT